MITQLHENLQKAFCHPELSTSHERVQELLQQIQNGRFLFVDYDKEDGWFQHIKHLAEFASNAKILENANTKEILLMLVRQFINNSPTPANDWYSQIGFPRYIGRFAFLLKDALTEEETKSLLVYMEKGIYAYNEALYTIWTGTSLLWAVMNNILYAALTQDLSHIRKGIEEVTKELVKHKNGEYGIQEDFAFIPYPNQFYINETTYSFMEECAYLVYALQKTEYQIPVENLWTLGFYFVFGMQYSMRNNNYDYLSVGKALETHDALKAEPMRKAMWMFLTVEEMVCRDVMSEQFAALSYEMYSVKNDKYSYSTNTFISRKATRHISCVGTGPNTKIDPNNLLDNGLSANLYAGGATCIMTTGKEYDNIFPVWDFAHVPGTTAPVLVPKEFTGIHNKYCGGFSHADHGVIYQDINANGVTGVTSRFFIGDMMIALGANITSKNNQEIHTTLNQCWQTEDVESLEQGCYHDHVVYVQMDEQPILANQQNNVCTLLLNHGVNPKGATYAYGVIPAVSKANAKERAEELLKQVKVVRNDAEVQAIEYKNKIYCVFHQSGMYRNDRYNHVVTNGPSVLVFDI